MTCIFIVATKVVTAPKFDSDDSLPTATSAQNSVTRTANSQVSALRCSKVHDREPSRDAYDNALAESVIGLYKTELIKPRGPWRTAEQVEIATLDYVDWFNNRRLYGICGDIPPAELEQHHYRQNTGLSEAS